MKGGRIFLFLLLALWTLPLFGQDPSGDLNLEVGAIGQINRNGVNCRSHYNLDSEILEVLPQGSCGRITGISPRKQSIGDWGRHHWYELEIPKGTDSLTVWVYGAFIEPRETLLHRLNRNNRMFEIEWVKAFFAFAQEAKQSTTGLQQIHCELIILEEHGLLDELFEETIHALRPDFYDFSQYFYGEYQDSFEELDFVYWFLRAGADPDFSVSISDSPVSYYLLSPLSLALQHNDLDLMKDLLRAGVDVTTQDFFQSFQKPEIFDLFLDHGVDIDEPLRTPIGEGGFYEESILTLVFREISRGNLENVSFLLERDADPSKSSHFEANTLAENIAYENPYWVITLLDGSTHEFPYDSEATIGRIEINPMAAALFSGQSSMVELLKSYGAQDPYWIKKIYIPTGEYSLREELVIEEDELWIHSVEELYKGDMVDEPIVNERTIPLKEYDQLLNFLR